ncbi:MAG: hypothetical protein EA412_08830 [Chitinophagaceae bacterium]|nr:MAG: hypothetical protein EA412_08830 [Chitinophagaceae bacterium]
MKRIYIYIAGLLFFVLILSNSQLKASHAVGGDITYICLGNNQYEITLNLYRDCAGIGAPNTVNLTVSSQSCNQSFSTGAMSKVSFQEISPLCPQQMPQSRCNGGNLPGIEQHIYKGIVTLPQNCTDWKFSYRLCCRNSAITNLVSPGSQRFYIEAMVNNTNNYCNNSPYFTSLPVPYICASQVYNYNHGAIDVDGDQLVYSMITPLDNQNVNIPYVGGYNINMPMAVTGPFNFSTTTGQMNFNPSMTQNAVVTVKVEEFRNGVLVGYTMRDIQVIVINCSNTNPEASGINGGGSFTTNVCAGSPLCFDILTSDPDGDNVTLTWNSGIPGGTFTTTGGQFPTGTFCWTPLPSDTGSHSFLVTATDDACPLTASNTYTYEIQVDNPVLTAIETIQDASCVDALDGSISLDVSGGSGNYTFSWSHNANINDSIANNLAPGNYSITIDDGTNCPLVKVLDVGAPDSIDIQYTSVPASCFGTSDGSIELTVTGGNAPFLYSFNGGGNISNNLFPDLSAGNYTIEVTDDNGCTATETIEVTEPDAIESVIDANAFNGGYNLSCHNGNDGSFTTTVTGGNAPYSFNWDNNLPSVADQQSLSAGTYTVEIVDDNNCIHFDTITLIEPDSISILSDLTTYNGGYNISCNGLNDGNIDITISGGVSPFTYDWNSGLSNQQNLTNAEAGLYELAVTDANGCIANVSETLTEPDPLNFSIDSNEPLCFGDNNGEIEVLVSGGSGTYLYSLNGAAAVSTNTFSALQADTYNIEITDDNNCVFSDDYTLNQPDDLSASLTATQYTGGYEISCFGGSDGEIFTNVSGGTAPYSFNWNNGQYNQQDLQNLIAGDYELEVTDDNGCTFDVTISLEQPDSVVIASSVSEFAGGYNISCYGASDGFIDINLNGGVGPFSYNWNNGQYNQSSISNLEPGNYDLIVTFGNGCSQTYSVELLKPEPLSFDLASSDFNSYGISCYGYNDGYITLEAEGGSGNYTIDWNNGTYSGDSLTDLAPGNYSFILTDENACTTTGNITLTEPELLVLDIVSSDAVCFDGDEGIAASVVEGGVEPYSYLWDNGNESAINDSLPFGSYFLTVTDDNGCEVSGSAFIDQPDPPQISVSSSNTDLFFGQSTSLQTTIIEGLIPPLTYHWEPGDGLSCVSCPNPVATPLETTTYLVEVTDANNCKSTDEITIEVNPFDKRIYVPNIFSPNGDGVNDVFQVYGLGIRNIELRVFDRWGGLLYETSDINSGWDGTFNGRNMEQGVYIYYVKFIFLNGDVTDKKGSVTLVR